MKVSFVGKFIAATILGMSAAFFAPDVCRNDSFRVLAEGDFITHELALPLMETHFDRNTETLDLSNLEYTHIDENAFAGKEFEKIKVVILPKNCQFVNKSAFKGLQLEKVVFPLSIFGIGTEAFADCCKLKEVNFIGTKETPSRLCWIKYGAFKNTGIEEISIPDNCKEIGEACFALCKNLKKVIIPPSVNLILDQAFGNCLKLREVTFTDPSSSKLEKIGDHVFIFTAIENILIPDGCYDIGKGCFEFCTNLTKITIPDTVFSFKTGVFKNCNKLECIDFKNKTNGTTTHCGLENFEIPDNIVSIKESCFYGNKILKHIKIPKNLISIGGHAFAGTDVESIECNNKLVKIDEHAFENCSKLKHIKIPKDLTSTRKAAFANTDVESIECNEKLVKIDKYAFMNCRKLKHIKIPENLTSIGKYAFANTNIESIECNNNLVKINECAFMDCDKLTHFNAPESLTVVDKGSFHGCSKLVSACFPASTPTIINDCFNNCPSLQIVCIPEAKRLNLLNAPLGNMGTNENFILLIKAHAQINE